MGDDNPKTRKLRVQDIPSEHEIMYSQEECETREPRKLEIGEELQGKFGRYVLEETLGMGQYSTVYKAKWYDGPAECDGTDVALKTIDLRGTTSRMLSREVISLYFLSHPNIIAIHDHWVCRPEMLAYIVTDFIPGGSLDEYLHGLSTRLTEDKARHYFMQILCAVKCCHDNKIRHRDLKLDNVFIDTETDTIKLGDFGSSFGGIPESTGKTPLKSPVGTYMYMAPEILMFDNTKPLSYDGEASDVWSLGMILYTLVQQLNAYEPMGEDEDLVSRRLKQEFRFRFLTSFEFRDLVDRMLVAEPEGRPSLRGVMMHPWMRNAASVPGFVFRANMGLIPLLDIFHDMAEANLLGIHHRYQRVDLFSEEADVEVFVEFFCVESGNSELHDVSVRLFNGKAKNFKDFCEKFLFPVIRPLSPALADLDENDCRDKDEDADWKTFFHPDPNQPCYVPKHLQF